MTKTKIPVGLPYPNPTKAYWQTPPLPISDHRTTPNLPSTAKYVVVGSGVSGAVITHKLLKAEPSAKIVMLEARQTCSGATGRNGGHCQPGWYTHFKDDLEMYGEEEALKMEKLEEDNVRNVGEFVKKHSIDCDLRAVELFDITTDQKKFDDVLASLNARREVRYYDAESTVLTKHRIWSKKDTREKLLVPEGVGAISFPAFKLSPYKFVCGILEMCLNKGLNLQTNTPVLEVAPISTRDGRKRWIVHTERGVIMAEKVILATNAYTSALYPPLSAFIIPTRAQIAAVRPGSNIPVKSILEPRSYGLENSYSGEYMQTRSEGTSGAGDVIIGGGRRLGTHGEQPVLDDTTIHPVISDYLRHACTLYFGKENWGEEGETLMEWTGIMGYTADSQPVVGEAPGQEGLFLSVGFNGHGMALTFQSAEALVQIIQGKEKQLDEWFPKCYRISRVPKLER